MTVLANQYRPNLAPTKTGVPVRDNMKFSTTWGVPSEARNTSNNSRWTNVTVRWKIYYVYDEYGNDSSNGGNLRVYDTQYQTYWTEGPFCTGEYTSSSITLTRNHFYPNNQRKLKYVSCSITPANVCGYGPARTWTFTMNPPAAPTVSKSISSTGTATFTIKNSKLDSKNSYDRSHTEWKLTRKDSKGVTYNNRYIHETVINKGVYNSYGSSNLEKKISNDPGVQTSIQPGQWIQLKFTAFNKGVGGKSKEKTSTHIFCYPAKATISKIKLSDPAHPMNTTQTVNILLNTNSSTYAIVDEVKLEKLFNTTAATAVEANLQTGWSAVDGCVDNANCKGFSDSASGTIPDVGKHTWYRLVTKHGNLTQTSVPVEAKDFFRKEGTAADDSVTVISCNANRDGTSIEVTLGWKNDDSTGTEVSWSKYIDAWNSNNQPETYRVTWKDPTPTPFGYQNTAKLYIRGLEEFTKYYIKARRYKESTSGGSETFGKYNTPIRAEDWPVITLNGASEEYKVKNVQLHIEQPFIEGKDIPVSWSYECEWPQTNAQIKRLIRNAQTGAVINNSTIYSSSGSEPFGVIKSSAFSTSAIETLTKKKMKDLQIYLYVIVECGDTTLAKKPGGVYPRNSSASDYVPITIMYPPKPITFGSLTLSQQPLKLSCTSGTALQDLILTIRSRGGSVTMPDKVRVQAEGDVLYSGRVSPTWTAKSGKFTGSITLPSTLEFLDGVNYILECTVVNKENELHSETKRSNIKVSWAYQAKPPATTSKVVANANSKYATIYPVAPIGGRSTDVCDIYRVTPDGAYSIASGVAFGSQVIDRYAPYSKTVPLSYRIATRTIDGDVEFLDVPYNLTGYSIRFDWDDGKILEVPYNLKYTDSYSKDFEERAHLNGEHSGYWNTGHSRSTSVSTNMIRLEDPDQIRLARELAQYSGAVYVRFPNACAFMANVDVKTISDDYSSLVLDVAFEINEVLLTSEFTVRVSDIKKANQ